MAIRILAALMLAVPAGALELDVPAVGAARVVRPSPRKGSVDCKDIRVSESGEIRSPGAWLESKLYSDSYGHNDGAGYGNDYEGRQGRRDTEETGETHRERVQLQFVGDRATLPWESEVFAACLEGTVTSLRPKKTAYRYEIVEDSREPGNFILTAGPRTPMDPDPKGVTAELVNGPSGIVLRITDKWAEEYAGERLAVKAELWQQRDGLFGFDSRVTELSGDVASPTQLGLGFAGFTQAGERYYAKWSFRRVGSLSKGTELKGPRTATVRFVP